MRKRSRVKIVFISQLLVLLFLSQTIHAQKQDALLEFYKGEHLTWIEYIEKFSVDSTESNIDVSFYDLNLEIKIDSPYIEGSVLCKFEATENNVQNIKIDLHSAFTVDSILGNVKSFDFANDIITIAFNTAYQMDEIGQVEIFYHGVPELAGGYKGLRYEYHADNQPIIASLSTPFLAHYWWPCKDGPGDKPDSVYIDITIPDTTINDIPLIAVSNGVLENTISKDGKIIFQWRERYPIVTYYVMVAISNYKHYQQIYSDSSLTTFPIDYYTFNENLSQTIEGVQQLPEVMNLFSNLFGTYPFSKEKYGMTELGFYGAIENQTNTITNNMSLDWFDVSVHELSHMWFGDMITCKDWHHGWLNEGFATYCEGLWIEHNNGFAAYQNYIKSIEYRQSGSIYLEDASDPFNIFIQIIYNKGANVLHMLRGVLGDSLFFSSLNQYANTESFIYDHATTEDFQRICEEVGGINLDKFFNAWVYGEYYPNYSYRFTIDTVANGYDIQLTVEQTQSSNLFWMPIQIKVKTNNDDYDFTIWDSLQTQTFTLNVNSYPTEILLDPDNWILKEVSEIVNPPLNMGVLLVNGLDWSVGEEVYDAYNSNAFWGNTEISFWDIFDEPFQGYPASLPERIGNGEISNSVISNYSTILWLSDYRSDDTRSWRNLAINSYLNEGGNVILITKRGRDFIGEDLRNYLGINWDATTSLTIKDMKSVNGNFTDIDLISDNTLAALFDTTLTQDYSELIYISTELFDSPKGSGIWSKPNGKGQFVYIAGRPYKYDHSDLSINLENILVGGMGAPVSVNDKANQSIPSSFELAQNYPNPFNPSTIIQYSIPEHSKINIEIFNMLGQSVKTLVNSEKVSGYYETTWNAENLSSGIYFIKISAKGLNSKKNFTQIKKAVLLK